MFSKKTICKVCGKRFTPKKDDIYTAEEPRSVSECLTKAPVRFSAIDCPRCGIQIPLAIRIPRMDYKIEMESSADEDKVDRSDLQEDETSCDF